jgi:carbonic anhydrase
MPTSELWEGHRRFKDRFASMRELYERQAVEGQSPKALWIGCSDSRVVPEIITAANPGDLFIMRNIANIVAPCGSPEGDQTGAVVEYAVLALRVAHIVVCGHTGCGGIQALCRGLEPASTPHLSRWIELARPALHPGGVDAAERESESIKANVLLQCANLLTYPCVAERVASGALTVHACMYDMRSGDLLVAGDGPGDWMPFADA